MFGKEKREAEDQRDAAVAIAFQAILMANNGELMIERLNRLVQYALDQDGNQYPYNDAMYVRDRILDRLKKKKGDKSYLDVKIDWKNVDMDDAKQIMNKEREANSTPKSWKQLQDDYFHKLSAGHSDKEAQWREDFRNDFGCTFD